MLKTLVACILNDVKCYTTNARTGSDVTFAGCIVQSVLGSILKKQPTYSVNTMRLLRDIVEAFQFTMKLLFYPYFSWLTMTRRS